MNLRKKSDPGTHSGVKVVVRLGSTEAVSKYLCSFQQVDTELLYIHSVKFGRQRPLSAWPAGAIRNRHIVNEINSESIFFFCFIHSRWSVGQIFL